MSSRERWADLRARIVRNSGASGLRLRALIRRGMRTFWVAGVIHHQANVSGVFGVGHDPLEAFTDLARQLGALAGEEVGRAA